MLKVAASAKPSSIHGLGLFANERISKGTITWEFDPQFDIVFDPKEVATMSAEKRDLIDRYAYLSKKSKKYIYSIDDTRFANHSAKNPSIGFVSVPESPEIRGIALRDIEAGEELTINYRLLDVYDESSKEAYLDS